MRFDHNTDYFYKFPTEIFGIEYSFVDNLAEGDTLSTATVTVYDEDGNDVSSSFISGSVSVVSPCVYFTVKNGIADVSYELVIKGTSTASDVLIGKLTCEVFGSITINSKLGDRGANSYVTLAQANDYIRSKYGHSSIWDALSVEGKKRVLIQAAREIDRFRFYGDKYYESQPMKFPRGDHEVITGNCGTPIATTYFQHSNLYSSVYGDIPTNYWKYGSMHITVGTPLSETSLIATSNSLTGQIIFSTLSATPTSNSQFIVFAPIYQDVQDAQCEQALYIVGNNSIESLSAYKSLGADYVQIGDAFVRFTSQGSGTTSIVVAPRSKRLLKKYIQTTLTVYRG